MNDEQRKAMNLAHLELLKALADLQRIGEIHMPENFSLESAKRRLLSAEERLRELVESRDF